MVDAARSPASNTINLPQMYQHDYLSCATLLSTTTLTVALYRHETVAKLLCINYAFSFQRQATDRFSYVTTDVFSNPITDKCNFMFTPRCLLYTNNSPFSPHSNYYHCWDRRFCHIRRSIVVLCWPCFRLSVAGPAGLARGRLRPANYTPCDVARRSSQVRSIHFSALRSSERTVDCS